MPSELKNITQEDGVAPKGTAPTFSSSDPTPIILTSRCPSCQKLAQHAFRPFCSKHCADVDLSRWLNGVYAIPARDEDEGDGQSSSDF